MKKELALAKLNLKAEATIADRIIRYMLQPDDGTIQLSEAEKKRYDILKFTHGLRMRYGRKGDVIKMLCHMYDFKDRQAYNYVTECEYVFASLEDVNKDYERNFILEASRKNIEIAMATRKSDLITKALQAHYEFCGLRDITIDMPDFSALEPNNYTISLPPAQQEMLTKLLTNGSVNFEMLFPSKDITFDIPYKDVSNADEV